MRDARRTAKNEEGSRQNSRGKGDNVEVNEIGQTWKQGGGRIGCGARGVVSHCESRQLAKIGSAELYLYDSLAPHAAKQ